ncbi:hypothetical protein G0Q06_12930 [Puniceicoccales bacterium CK1056]|uniref:Uncharacterized protein n=1 Tax=Oceanipulchritudo coccoides TaxID=2706888 RepID=A0A6B2M504_9BACT|nr:hypothetical protein [Oceanipulchritudo coccoides]NDV63362.1 hypothetical protein [Oceanipulchritudo coccoides]
MSVYIASKTRHAPRWRSLRSEGQPIISSWLDESDDGQTKCFSELAERCISEASQADVVLLYWEPNADIHGALIEAGAALASGRMVVQVDESEEDTFSKVFKNHPRWKSVKSLEEAFEFLHSRQENGYHNSR